MDDSQKRVAAVLCLFWFETVVIFDYLRQLRKRSRILCPATQMKSTFTARRRALRVNNTNPFVPFPTPHPLPSLSWTLQDGRWVKDAEDSAVDRGKSKPSTWFRCLSTLGCAVAQLSGQTATDSCCQLELLEPHSLRHLSSAAVFYTFELALLATAGCGHCSRLRQCWGTTFHLVQEQKSAVAGTVVSLQCDFA